MNTKCKKITSAVLSATTAVWLSGAMAFMPVVSQAQTASDLQAQITALLAQIATLQSQLGGLQGGSSAVCGFTFSANLMQGSTGTDVMNLQKALNADGVNIAVTGAGSPGNETSYFGSLTKAGVTRFQNKYASEILAPLGLINGTGYVGASTRAKLNSLFGTCGTTPTPTPTGTGTPAPVPQGTGLTVTLAPNQPTSSLFPGTSSSQAARVPFTVINFTASSDGDVTVNSVTVERTGLGVDANFAGVVLLDETGMQIGLEKTLNSNHQAVLNEPFVVKAGQTRTLTVAGNAADNSTRAGQVAFLSVVAVNTSATVNGTLPLTGSSQTVSGTLSIGSVTMARGPLDPGASATKKIGTTGYTFSSVKVTAGSVEKVKITSVRWNQSGSAASTDLENVKIVVDGTEYAPVISSDGKYYSASFGSGILVDKGFSKEISIKGDILSGSNRTVDFDIYKRTDLYLVGENFNYGIIPPLGSSDPTDDTAAFSTTNPWYDAAQVTVSEGTINVTKASTVAAQNIAVNLADQPLGGFQVEVKGEPMSVSAMTFRVEITQTAGSAVGTDLDNVTLVGPSGSVVAGPIDATGSGTTATIAFTDTVTYPIGIGVYTLKGKLTNDGTTDFANNDTLAASTTPSSDWTTTGLTTGNSITETPASAVTGNTMTVKTTALTVSVSTAPVAQTVVAGITGFTFANYIFDASQSGEDTKLTNIQLEYNSQNPTDLSNCQLFDGSTSVTSGSNVVNPSAQSSTTSFTFDGSGLVLAKGTTKTLALKCDISGNASTGRAYYWGIDGAADTNYTAATGLTSGQTVAEVFTDSIGQAMTIGAGTLAVELDTSSPSYSMAPSGATGVTLSALRVKATNEEISLKKIALQLSNTASNSPIDLVGGLVTLWDGTTQVGSATFVGDVATATISNLTIPKDGYKIVTLKGDLAAIGSSQPGTQGALITVDYDNDDSTGTSGIGASSGATRNRTSGSDSASSGVRVFRSVPTFARIALPTTELPRGTNTGTVLARFSVTANASGDVSVYKLTFEMGSSTVATTSAFGLYAFSDSGFSQVVNLSGGSSGLLNAGNGAGDGSAFYCTTSQIRNVEIYMNPSSCGAGTTTLQIPAGTTRYFELRGTVSGAAGGDSISDSISIKLLGDAAYPSLAASTLMNIASTIDSDSNDDLIWSPNATGTSAITANDFTNGYSIVGLPSTNMDSWAISESTQ